jgi:hypothetical protein
LQYKISKSTDGDKPEFKLCLIVVLPNLIKQWAEEIQTITTNLDIYIYYSDVCKQIGNNAAILDDKLKPGHYLFSKDSPKNTRAVVLTSYQTLNTRHGPMALKEFCQKKKLPYNPANPVIPDSWGFNLKGCFHTAVLDKAHILRNPTSAVSHAVHWLQCDFNLLLTATPFYNSILDFRSYMPLLFVGPSGHGKRSFLPQDLFMLPSGHPNEHLVCSVEVVEKEILAQNLGNFTKSGTKMRKVLSQLMVRWTLLSCIPFKTGPMISTNIPGSQRKAFFISFEKGEKDSYQAYEMKNHRGLFVCDSIDPTKFH